VKCPKCGYVFSEEYTQCLKCGNTMTLILEVLGDFPSPAKEPFLSVEDFMKQPLIEEPEGGETPPPPKEIELKLPE